MEESMEQEPALAEDDSRRRVVAEELYSSRSALRSWETRVLALQPGARGEELVADIHVAVITHHNGFGLVSEDRNEEYEALSYTWGNPEFTHTLMCNGLPIGITHNLHEALQRLRRRRGSRYLWVDAICINQFDNTERARQIRNLFVIFQRARRVIVWLGPATRHTKCALEFSTALTRLVYRRESNLSKYETWHEADARVETRRALRSRDYSEVIRILQGLLDLAHRLYMRRAWIVQEVHAASEITVRCGPHKVTWKVWTQLHNSLQAVIWYIRRHEQAHAVPSIDYFSKPLVLPLRNAARSGQYNSMHRALQSAAKDSSADDSDSQVSDHETHTSHSVEELWGQSAINLDGIAEIMDFLRIYGPATESVTDHQRSSSSVKRQRDAVPPWKELTSIVLRASHLRASDDRDRIFALLGLTTVPVSYGAATHDIGTKGIAISYDQSASAVYQNVTKYLLQQCQHLGPLYYKWAESDDCQDMDMRHLELPSWCPDFRRIDWRRYLSIMPTPRQHPWDKFAGGSLEMHLSCMSNAARYQHGAPYWPGTYFVQSQDLATPEVLLLKGRVIGHVHQLAPPPKAEDSSDDTSRHSFSMKHSGVMNSWIMRAQTRLSQPAHMFSPLGPSHAAEARPLPQRKGQARAQLYTSWTVARTPQIGDILVHAFGGLLPLVLQERQTGGYVCCGYAAPSRTVGQDQLLDLLSTSLLTAGGIPETFEVH